MEKDDEVYRKFKDREKKLKELDKKIKTLGIIDSVSKKQFAQYTTRVELQCPNTKKDYQKLDSEMGKEKFTRTIFHDGSYKLPAFEYNKEGIYSTRQVLNSAIRAATKTGKKFTVLVTKSMEREFVNLEHITK